MRQARVLYHLMRADFLERVRRYSFLITLGLAAWLGWAVSTGKLKLWISDSRGLYNSAWVGLLMALVVNVFVSLAGFYVVKNAVERDRRTGVRQHGRRLLGRAMRGPEWSLFMAARNIGGGAYNCHRCCG